MQLLELLVDVRLDRRVADVGVDLDARHLADRHRIEALRQVIHVRRNDESPPGDLGANRLDRELFPVGDAAHLFGDGTLAAEMHLGNTGHERVSLTETGAGSGERYPTVQTALWLRTGVNRSLLPAPCIRQSNLTARAPLTPLAAWASRNGPPAGAASPIPRETRTGPPRSGDRAREYRPNGRSRAATARPSVRPLPLYAVCPSGPYSSRSLCEPA